MIELDDQRCETFVVGQFLLEAANELTYYYIIIGTVWVTNRLLIFFTLNYTQLMRYIVDLDSTRN